MYFCKQKLNKSISIFFVATLISFYTNAQDFMMQGWYWDYPKTASGFNWADTLHNKAANIGDAGFTYMWLPPLSRASFGSGSNGYDPQDLYDLGIPSQGATGFGTRAQVDAVISAFAANGVDAVADVVYNHRDGGAPEDNPSVEGWIENLGCAEVNAGQNAYPSDRFRCYLPLGGSSGNGASTYYFKFRSASLHPNYYNKEYNIYMQTNTTGFQGLPEQTEDESAGGNGGGDCGQGNNTMQLGRDMIAYIDDVGGCGGGCGIDEFQVTITASDFNPAGDTLWIFMNNPNGNYSDHYVNGLWNGTANVQNQIQYQTYTDFTNMPSGRGGMDYTYFKPNGNPTSLEGDWDWMWFFYDYDQRFNQATKDTLNVWTKWLWDDVGIRGLRMDAVKHFNHEFTGDLMDYLHDNNIDPGMVVGEFFDGNPSILTNWVNSVESYMDADTKAAIKVRAFDFGLRSVLKEACDNFNPGYDVRSIYSSGMVNGAGANSYNSVTFVNNHDFRDAGQAVQNDPMLAYAYILTNNQIGLPCVYYPDYFSINIPNAPSVYLKSQIDTLMTIHKEYIFQSSSAEFLNASGSGYGSNYFSGSANKSLIYQLTGGIGGKEVVVAINFSNNALQVDHAINTSNLMIGDTLFDMLGKSNFPYALVSGSNQIYIDLPPRSYSVWINSNPVPLPIELVDFSAVAKKESVYLNWETLSEVDFDGFEIQRSVDGKQFEKLSWEAAKGIGHYFYTDEVPPLNTKLYYRLKSVDLDGSFDYSDIKSVYIGKNISEIMISPNPVRSSMTLSFNSNYNKSAIVELFDLKGNQLLSKNIKLNNGFNETNVNMNDFSQGVYLVNIILEHQVFTQRVVLIKK